MQRLILPSSPTRSKPWGNELGFQDISIADAGTEMKQVESDLQDWLSKVCHGEMDYMASTVRGVPSGGTRSRHA